MAKEILTFLDLAGMKHRVVVTLPYGLQERVDFARALACRPELLLYYLVARS
jgi:branched-chain amino acid transport system ATP-binding protein